MTKESNEWRMKAYYYSFNKTGKDCIDKILSAVACAGKGWHHTEDWNNEVGDGYHNHLRGSCAEAWIQNSADDAAKIIDDLDSNVASQKPAAPKNDLVRDGDGRRGK